MNEQLLDDKINAMVARLAEIQTMPRTNEIIAEETHLENEIGKLYSLKDVEYQWPECGVPV